MKEHLGPVGEPHHLALNKLMTRTLTTSRVSPLDKNMTLKKKKTHKHGLLAVVWNRAALSVGG